MRPKADTSVRVKLYMSGSLPRSHAGVFEKNRLYGLETSSRDLSLVHPSFPSSLRGSNNKFDSYVSSKCLCASRVRGLNLTRFSRVSPSARHGETPPQNTEPRSKPLLSPPQIRHLGHRDLVHLVQCITVDSRLPQDRDFRRLLLLLDSWHEDTQILERVSQLYPPLAFHVVVQTPLLGVQLIVRGTSRHALG